MRKIYKGYRGPIKIQVIFAITNYYCNLLKYRICKHYPMECFVQENLNRTVTSNLQFQNTTRCSAFKQTPGTSTESLSVRACQNNLPALKV